MKQLILSAGLCALPCLFSVAQSQQARPIRRLGPHMFAKDSAQLFYNERYQWIEDSCAAIVRYAHYDPRKHLFYREFKDVRKDSPQVVIAQGTYNNDGLKDGDFTAYYMNGRLESKSSYKNNKLTGRGEVYYPDGKPKLNFEVRDSVFIIHEAWNTDGKKTVDAGKGAYKVIDGNICWEGKITNGRPNGNWEASFLNGRSDAPLLTEKFKDNKFVSGAGPTGVYTDSSRLVLIAGSDFPFVAAEVRQISRFSCVAGYTAPAANRIINAHYSGGSNEFAQRIADAVRPFLQKMDLSPFDTDLTLTGEVYKNGIVGGWRAEGMPDHKIETGIINSLIALPNLEPASLNGEPVVQKIAVIFKFSRGQYSIQYRLLPVKAG